MKIPEVHISLVSDFICPWCYLGKTRLIRLKELLKNELSLVIDLKPFVLYPSIPKGGSPKEQFAKKTKTGMGRSLRAEAQMENIEINYKYISTIPNSLEAHRLCELIEDPEKKWDVGYSLIQKYFQEGADIEDPDLLSTIANSHNVKEETISLYLDTKDGTAEVDQALQQAKAQYVSVVPSIILDNGLILPGLQTLEVWTNYMRKALRLQENQV